MVHDFLVSFSCRGTQHFTGTVSNEATSEMGYPAWPAERTCTIFQFRQWQPAKPSTGMSFRFFFFIMDKVASEPSSEQGRRKHTWNFVSNSFQTTVRFSQSDLLLTSSDGTVASSKDVERIPLYCFSRLVIHFLLSDFTGLFFAREMHSTSVIR